MGILWGGVGHAETPVGPLRHPAYTPPDTQRATEKDISVVLLGVGWTASCKTSAQRSERKKKILLLPPQTKITILITMVMFSVRPQCGWQDPGEVALARWGRGRGLGRPPGKLQGGASREQRPASAPRCQPGELLLAASELFSVSSLASGDNWRCSQCKHVFFFFIFIFFSDQSCVPLFQAEVLRHRPACSGEGKKKKKFFFLTFSKWTNLSFSVVSYILTPLLLPVIFSAVSCLPFLFFHLPLSSQQSLPALPPPLSVCALITSPNWQ